MSIEIERKFKVNSNIWRDKVEKKIEIKQGYILDDGKTSLRIRQKNEKCFLSVKSKIDFLQSYDFEYQIPQKEADIYLKKLSKTIISKTRNYLHVEGMLWEIDEFHLKNSGLIVAEIELLMTDQSFATPPWLGEEVTKDLRYLNINLSKTPYSTWS